jgi:pilus assembly protein FimV
MMRKKLSAYRAFGAHKTMQKPQWRSTALAIATAVLFGFSASDASALALGRVTVQSALGEPLRADIEIPEITAEELTSLRATIASPEAFRAAGFDYNPAMANIQITLQRRPDGGHYLHLSSSRPVNDPFVDLILEANWASGRMVRDYTLLFDPTNLRQSAPPLPAAVAPPAPAGRTQPGPASKAAKTAPGSAGTSGQSSPAKAGTDGSKKVTVQSGDTAGKIAAANKATNVSLDQMLIALLHANPQAFVGGNVNRLKAGAVLDLPTSEEAESVSSGEARQSIVAQSRDFNEFRRRLAEGLPAAAVGGSERSASGRVQAQVEEKKPAVAAPDKLTLSKGAVQGKAAADKIARDRAAQDNATRVAELNKNISDLNKLGISAPAPLAGASTAKTGLALPVGAAAAAKSASAPAAAPVPTAAASTAKTAPPTAASPVSTAASSAKPAVPAPAAAGVAIPPPASVPAAAAMITPPASATAAAVAVAVPASAPAAAPALAASAATGAASAAAPDVSAAASAAAPASAAVMAAAPAVSASKPRPAAAPAPSSSLVDELLENPMVPASVGAVLALLLGFGFYRAQQRKKTTQVDSSFLESRLQPDSFFGASGGQRIDTNEGNATGSSMVYSPSQLDAAGDVDPVAEADVYLAYGRDLQAEEILKEAMRTTPQRVAVHCKLLEIYAKRRDGKAFELISSEAYNLTRGEGSEWEHICELGKELDPSNALYRPGCQPAAGVRPAAAPAGAAAPANDFRSQATQTIPLAPGQDQAADIDLDLDFSIGDDAPPPEPPKKASASMTTSPREQPVVAEPMPSLDMEFGSTTAAVQPPAAAERPATQRSDPARVDAPNVNVAGNGLSFTATQTLKPQSPAVAPAPAAAADAGMIEFDLGALSLDLESSPAPAPSAPSQTAAARLPTIEEAVDSAVSTAGLDDNGDPLATKLALAKEFNAIGDPDGARSLAEEVVAEASGDLKKKAQRFLSEIA